MSEAMTESIKKLAVWAAVQDLPDDERTAPKMAEARRRFDAWLAEVERAAAEKAYERCVREMPFDTDWKIFYVDNNPYRAAAYRREETE